jgi:hypothetical protein
MSSESSPSMLRAQTILDGAPDPVSSQRTAGK